MSTEPDFAVEGREVFLQTDNVTLGLGLVVVRVTNEVELSTSVHWHGVRLDNRFDGVPGLTQAPIERTESFTYEVHVPDAGMFWYHPHSREDVQQDLGLYGNLLVDSPAPDYLGPAHREEVLVLDDILMDELGMIPWGQESPTHALMGRFGTVMLLNGVPDYRLEVRRGEVVRFYFTNVANTRTFNVRFPRSPPEAGGIRHRQIRAGGVGGVRADRARGALRGGRALR